jgi:hypothetical protein
MRRSGHRRAKSPTEQRIWMLTSRCRSVPSLYTVARRWPGSFREAMGPPRNNGSTEKGHPSPVWAEVFWMLEGKPTGGRGRREVGHAVRPTARARTRRRPKRGSVDGGSTRANCRQAARPGPSALRSVVSQIRVRYRTISRIEPERSDCRLSVRRVRAPGH